ncbi:mechanosensitive ion channel domain-containing protein [Shewanella sp. NIFS-20-20]|uniref:mechanosensitive ion channel domain-containing protein n=1 Tax=Shewanella sp. NIFS-20-20 TaxID=2853806 RepID=UPI001C439D27|nr:mechanosensitive ion channel domain-containing protein [Shewanella sp. NIFS-20-20]MBV7317534.1 mechanosensitive ion channel [Shewanella sp. NIFS-20-20]
MSRFICFLLSFISVYSFATSPLALEKRMGMSGSQEQTLSVAQQIEQLDISINSLHASQLAYEQSLRDSEIRRHNLNTQLKNASDELAINAQQDLGQQASMAYLHLSELKETEANLGKQINDDIQRQKLLPQTLKDARDAIALQQKNVNAPPETPTGQLQRTQLALYQQHLLTLQAELNSSPSRLELAQLQLQSVRAQLLQQEVLIEALNRALSDQRRQNTEHTLLNNLSPNIALIDDMARNLSQTNIALGDELTTVTEQTNEVVRAQEDAENQYQQQAKQLGNIQQQISWVQVNSAFGERFLQMLQSLPRPPDTEAIQIEIADARLSRYHIEQQLNQNEQLLGSDGNLSEPQIKLLDSQQSLLNKLLESYDIYLGETAKLKFSYEQLNQQYQELKNTLNEHLFWVPNAAQINKPWFIDLQRSIVWLVQQAPWQKIPSSFTKQADFWSWWVILLTLCIVIQDLIAKPYHKVVAHYSRNVGNVTQDRFSNSLKSLLISFGYASLRPLPVIAAGAIAYSSSHNFIQAIGMATLAIGGLYLLQRVIDLLCAEGSLISGHFNTPRADVVLLQTKFDRFVIMVLPLVGIMGFTEVLDTSLIRNSLGRGAFILFCILLFLLYRDLVNIFNRARANADHDGKNKRLIHKTLSYALISVPLISAVLAFMGFYYTAFQLLLQLQLSLVLGLAVLLSYQLIKRWMLIERRRIAFERAKAKRAERLAQREKGEAHANDGLDSYEEPIVDLETISSQSLGLVRSLLLLGFLASLIGLWTQTHMALFSFLDGITLWSSTTSINGIEQQLPITLKSLLFGLIIVGFSMMIATNLPGLLELMILQRLDLSPGTGFAITTVSRYLVVFFGTLVGFSTLGMEWSKLQWLIAALSVGLGFGLQEIFANFISGLIILFEKPVRIGDTVTIRDLTGTVSKIQIRATTIIDWDRKEIIVPNKAFITEQLINWSLSDPITRVIINVSVARDSDPSKVEAALYQAVQDCQLALLVPEPEIWFAGFGQHTQDYEVRAYAKDMNSRWPLRHDLHKRISQKLKENDLQLAYPQLEIHLSQSQRENNPIMR